MASSAHGKTDQANAKLVSSNMKTQHTPGPWGNNKWNCQEHQISANGGTIALVSHSRSLVPENEADANARLIAAAPDLLEALKYLDGELKRRGFDFGRLKIKEAITKAEGKV